MSHWKPDGGADRVTGMIGKAAQGWFVAFSLGAASACGAAPDAQGRQTMIPAPPGATADLGTATGDPAADSLSSFVSARVAPQRIAGARYFRMPSNIGWNAVSKFVAGQRAPGGTPPKPRFVDGGLDLLDVYPPHDGKPAFVVAMAREPASDGTHLVGYFDLGD